MANRNELHIHQSGDPMGVIYDIFRSDTMDVSDTSLRIATVAEENVLHTAYEQLNEVLVQDEINPFAWYTSKIYEVEPGFKLYANGVAIDPQFIKSTPGSKMFILNEGYDMTDIIVTADYWFLAAVVLDDVRYQPGVEYVGPPANAVWSPVNFDLTYDFTTYKMRVSWALDTTPKTFYYAVKATDRNGHTSLPSDEQHISLSIDPGTTSYVVEKAVQISGPWFLEGETMNLMWDDPHAAVGGHIPMELRGVRSVDDAKITLKNPWHDWESNWRASYFYRVSAKDDQGEMGPPAPSLPFYKGINIKPALYILRRKRDNGVPATLEGTDAITIKTWSTTEVDPTQENLLFTDSSLPPQLYSYTTYVIDEKGMVGQPFYTKVDMR